MSSQDFRKLINIVETNAVDTPQVTPAIKTAADQLLKLANNNLELVDEFFLLANEYEDGAAPFELYTQAELTGIVSWLKPMLNIMSEKYKLGLSRETVNAMSSSDLLNWFGFEYEPENFEYYVNQGNIYNSWHHGMNGPYDQYLETAMRRASKDIGHPIPIFGDAYDILGNVKETDWVLLQNYLDSLKK